MKQPTRKRKASPAKKSSSKIPNNKRKKDTGKGTGNVRRRIRRHPKYGTSKLEKDFASMFLDKLGLRYVYQFEAKDIGRFYDYYLPDSNLLIEVDGSYYHSDPRVIDRKHLNGMQKRNLSVDAIKDRWAALHCIPLLRIYEYDIRNNPEKVMEVLRERLDIQDEKIRITESKKKRGKPKQKKDGTEKEEGNADSAGADKDIGGIQQNAGADQKGSSRKRKRGIRRTDCECDS